MNEDAYENQVLTVQQVAKRLHKSRNWVYTHKDALAGFSACARVCPYFSQKKIEEIEEGAYAISNEKRKLASKQNDCGTEENQKLQDKGRSKKMGGIAKPREMATKDPHGLLV